MPKTRPPYSAEFRHRMVELVRAGRTPEELAQKFDLMTISQINSILVQHGIRPLLWPKAGSRGVDSGDYRRGGDCCPLGGTLRSAGFRDGR